MRSGNGFVNGVELGLELIGNEDRRLRWRVTQVDHMIRDGGGKWRSKLWFGE